MGQLELVLLLAIHDARVVLGLPSATKAFMLVRRLFLKTQVAVIGFPARFVEGFVRLFLLD